jgi:cytidylate kinase
VTVIAIDGPAGAGKSAVAEAVAESLGFTYVDTGAMYRTIALAVIDRKIDPSEQAAVEEVARDVAADMDLHAPAASDSRIRGPEVGTVASVVARYPGVRSALAERQRAIALSSDVVMEGRDIGTVIAPHAEVKIYLTASVATRAERRRAQLGLPNDRATLQRVQDEIAERDHTDSVRPESPLKPASGAVQIDSSDKDLSAVIHEVLKVVDERMSSS